MQKNVKKVTANNWHEYATQDYELIFLIVNKVRNMQTVEWIELYTGQAQQYFLLLLNPTSMRRNLSKPARSDLPTTKRDWLLGHQHRPWQSRKRHQHINALSVYVFDISREGSLSSRSWVDNRFQNSLAFLTSILNNFLPNLFLFWTTASSFYFILAQKSLLTRINSILV